MAEQIEAGSLLPLTLNRSSPMRIALPVVLAIAVLLGCEGPAGPVGPQGPPGQPGQPGAQGPQGLTAPVVVLEVPLRYDEDGAIHLRDNRISVESYRGLWWHVVDNDDSIDWLPWDTLLPESGGPILFLTDGSLYILDSDRLLLAFAVLLTASEANGTLMLVLNG